MMKSIDGTELKKHIESTICYGCQIGHVVPPCGRCIVTDLLKYIDEMPEVDAQPIKHGKWKIEIDRYMTSIYRCTVCGTRQAIARSVVPESVYGYCPNCGARMDGDSGD